jgi:hypothetical protein
MADAEAAAKRCIRRKRRQGNDYDKRKVWGMDALIEGDVESLAMTFVTKNRQKEVETGKNDLLSKKKREKFGRFVEKPYLCNRNSEPTRLRQ